VFLLAWECAAQINPPLTREQLRAAWQKDWTKVSEVPFNLLTECDAQTDVDPECNQHARQRSGTGLIFAPHVMHKVPKEARKAFQSALRISHTGDHRAAAEEFERAIRLDPDFAEAYDNVGIEYASTGFYQIAATRFKRAIELDPASPIAYSNLGVLLVKAGRPQEAETAFRRSLELSPGNANAHFLLGRLLLGSADNRTEAEQHLKSAAQTIPSAKELLKSVRQGPIGAKE
jgi:tetratricopeptide (TPR) repeat protein